MSASELPTVTPQEAFKLIKTAVRADKPRRIVPLFGSGISIDAGIPTSALLCDYILSVWEVARNRGWQDLRLYLRKYGWPSRHDAWADWIMSMPKRKRYNLGRLETRIRKSRQELYAACITEEIRQASPLIARLGKKQIHRLEALAEVESGVTDYRSLLTTVTENDSDLIDAFFDHFSRGRRPSGTHEFIAFITQLFGIKLILTTNFDPLIETALRDEGFSPTVYEVDKNGSVPSRFLVRKQLISVIKLHGGTHSLRAGYDLDDPLPLAALEETRNYLWDDRTSGSNSSDPALLLVLGYSGNDRRVMDIVAEHMSGWRKGNDPRVLWIGRKTNPPAPLSRAAKSAMASAQSFSSHEMKIKAPAMFCTYQSGRLFLQDLYQFTERQHAVSRTHYRAIISVPRSPQPNNNTSKQNVQGDKTLQSKTHLSDKAKKLLRTNRVSLFWANSGGQGTSEILKHAVDTLFSSTHEIIWIDAADFNSRASLLASIHEEFTRLDRGHARIARPLLLRDVDYFNCRRDALDIAPKRGDPIEEDDKWELEVAIRWVVHAMRRGNYVLAIDSLGGFARTHPSIMEYPSDSAEKSLLAHRGRQRKRLLLFLSRLRRRSCNFGSSLMLLALTPGVDDDVTPNDVQIREDLRLITGIWIPDDQARSPGKRLWTVSGGNVEIEKGAAPSWKKDKPKLAVERLAQLFQSGKRRQFAAGLMIAVASFFRRPRTRTALLTTFFRYLESVERLAHNPLYDYLDEKLGLAGAGNSVRFASKKVMARAEIALKYIETGHLPDSEYERLLIRLEGGYYWMHFGSRNLIYNELREPKSGLNKRIGKVLFPQELRAQMWDHIARFAIDDVYKRSLICFNQSETVCLFE